MTTTDLLRQAGLNQYEAEAYATLLMQGPLTGYELGKRSAIPLSRSYDVLERLTTRGLALVQPGDPPRYRAQPPHEFLTQLRASMATTVEGLASAFAGLPAAQPSDEFWVLRGRPAIVARATALIDAGRATVQLAIPEEHPPALDMAFARAQARGVRCLRTDLPRPTDGVALLVDSREALLGTLTPTNACQAVVSRNGALLATLTAALARPALAKVNATVTPAITAQAPLDWMEWEERKQRQVRQESSRVA